LFVLDLDVGAVLEMRGDVPSLLELNKRGGHSGGHDQTQLRANAVVER
jgi:hypothetical protein